MSEEFLIIGPPGTGKTSYVARQTQRAVQKYGKNGVLLCSLTKSAANEMLNRGLDINPDMVGTLHSHCFHLLGRPKMADTPEGLAVWNEENPKLSISQDYTNIHEVTDTGTTLLAELSLLRSKMVPKEKWPLKIRQFYRKWQAFKDSHDFLDFCDLIEIALHEEPFPPNHPQVIIADEAQDLSALEKALLDKWARTTSKMLIVGDKMQSLYCWRGADPDLLAPDRVDDAHRRVLSKTWRLPEKIKKYALEYAQFYIPGPEAQIGFESIQEEGEVIKNVPLKIDDIVSDLEKGKTPMVIASCGYMLKKITKKLREAGVPYHNPYVQRWNPLDSGQGVSIKARLVVYNIPNERIHGEFASFWDVDSFRLATENLTNVFKRGIKKKIKSLRHDTTPEDLALFINEMFKNESDREKFLSFDNNWWLDHYKKGTDTRYIRNILNRVGEKNFLGTHFNDPPQCIVGTIHSVKGGEADSVYLLPDLSGIGMRQFLKPGFHNKEAVVRMFYVGMTRAKEKLVLCNRITKKAVRWL